MRGHRRGAVRPGHPYLESTDRPGRRAVGWICWLYLVGMAMVWGLQAGIGDRWWPATILLYGPRWFWGLPLGVLVPLAIVANRQAIRPLLVAVVLLVGPVMGLCLPWQGWVAEIGSGAPQGPILRVVTCNTEGSNLDTDAFRTLIEGIQPDVVALQEWKDHHRDEVFRDEGWYYRRDGGLGLASRYPILSAEQLVDRRLLGRGSLVRYELDAPSGPIRLINLHLETPRKGIEAVLYRHLDGLSAFYENIDVRWRVSEAARDLAREGGEPDLIVGDFNLTSDSPIFRGYWTEGRDAYSTVGFGYGYSKYTRWFGARIDHVISGKGWRPSWCMVGPDVSSDHRPLMAELVRVGD